jgi:nucleotide-binding universal stress UspA family protein
MHRTRVIAFTVLTPFYFLKYTILLTAVIGSAVVPTLIAQRWLQPAFKPLAAETPTNVPAVTAALELARQTSAKVHMVAVEELPPFPASIDEVAEEKDEANHRLAPVIESARAEAAAAGVTIETHLVPGHVVDVVIGLIKRLNVDLLVVGFMGHSRLYGRIIGGATDRLVRLAPCAVLVVK